MKPTKEQVTLALNLALGASKPKDLLYTYSVKYLGLLGFEMIEFNGIVLTKRKNITKDEIREAAKEILLSAICEGVEE